MCGGHVLVQGKGGGSRRGGGAISVLKKALLPVLVCTLCHLSNLRNGHFTTHMSL